MKRNIFTLALIAASVMAVAQQQEPVSNKKLDSTPAAQQVANTDANTQNASSSKKQDNKPEKAAAPAEVSGTEAPALSGKRKPEQ